MSRTEDSTLIAVPGLREAVTFTIESGIHYQDDFTAACRPAWRAAMPTIERELPELVMPEGRSQHDGSPYETVLESLGQEPRGTWVVAHGGWTDDDGTFHHLWQAGMSDGLGGAHIRSDGWGKRPTYAEMLGRMESYEVYTVRRIVDEERATQRAVDALQASGWRVGMVIKDINVGGNAFSSAVISKINTTNGRVELTCTKRGSAKRYLCEAPCDRIKVKGATRMKEARAATGLFAAA